MAGSDFFGEMLASAIEAEVKRRVEEQIAEAQETLAQNLQDSVAKIVLGVLEQFSVERNQREILIRVKVG